MERGAWEGSAQAGIYTGNIHLHWIPLPAGTDPCMGLPNTVLPGQRLGHWEMWQLLSPSKKHNIWSVELSCWKAAAYITHLMGNKWPHLLKALCSWAVLFFIVFPQLPAWANNWSEFGFANYQLWARHFLIGFKKAESISPCALGQGLAQGNRNLGHRCQHGRKSSNCNGKKRFHYGPQVSITSNGLPVQNSEPLIGLSHWTQGLYPHALPSETK